MRKGKRGDDFGVVSMGREDKEIEGERKGGR